MTLRIRVRSDTCVHGGCALFHEHAHFVFGAPFRVVVGDALHMRLPADTPSREGGRERDRRWTRAGRGRGRFSTVYYDSRLRGPEGVSEGKCRSSEDAREPQKPV
eukprot:1196026-Prorocentrum_minimum.AAC.7